MPSSAPILGHPITQTSETSVTSLTTCLLIFLPMIPQCSNCYTSTCGCRVVVNQGVQWQMASLTCLGMKAHVYHSPETLGVREGARSVLGRQHGGT